mgnify:CR=1 FL=1
MFFKPFCLSIYLPTCHQQILSNAYHKKDAPRAVTCDDLHLRTSAQHWHISAFFVTGNSPEFPVITSENTLREFPLVIATVAKVSRKRGLWLVVRVKKETPAGISTSTLSLQQLPTLA